MDSSCFSIDLFLFLQEVKYRIKLESRSENTCCTLFLSTVLSQNGFSDKVLMRQQVQRVT